MAVNTVHNYIALFESNRELLKTQSGGILDAARDSAVEQLKQKGFPDKKQEAYQYTDIAKCFEGEFGLDLKKTPTDLKVEEEFCCSVSGLDSLPLYLVNGWFHSLEGTLPEGVIVCSLQEAVYKYPELVEKHYNKQLEACEDGVVCLNTAFALDGVFVYVPKGVHLEQCLQIVNIFYSPVDILVNQRNLVIVEPGGSAKILSCEHSLTHKHILVNQVNEIYAKEDAHIDFYAVQHLHDETTLLTSTFFDQARNSQVLSNNISMESGISRNNVMVKLRESGAGCEVYSMALAQGGQHIDNYSKIEHIASHCSSHQVAKNVLDDESTTAFCGHVLVHQDAQKTEALQSNQNLCLTREARVYTKPQLEIYADDVKCSHGATVGQLDEQALFYLRARGISEKEAKFLLMQTFTHDVVEHVRLDALKARLHDMVQARLRGEIVGLCRGCVRGISKNKT